MIKNKSPSKGFTMTEILVVIGTMAILSAISFSVFTRIREKGRSAQCQGNLKQIALAFQQYVQDNDGVFPSNLYLTNLSISEGSRTGTRVFWFDSISPYLKNTNVLNCPSDNLKNRFFKSYAINRQLNAAVLKDNQIMLSGFNESQFNSPSDLILNTDIWGGTREKGFTNASPIDTSCGQGAAANLHAGGGNFSYLDGHIKWLSPAQQADWYCLQKANSYFKRATAPKSHLN
ncbi:MAG: DUF1559 domain-containing protein [Sphingobacteriales bacterium]|nr:MAG: DUF1559 domain-containing protein [Sphingobacteriales bacterium]